MKILGTTPAGFILEASSDELAHLIGWHSAWSDEFRNARHKERLDVGREIKVSAMYAHLRALDTNSEQHRNIASQLRALADLLVALPLPVLDLKEPPK